MNTLLNQIQSLAEPFKVTEAKQSKSGQPIFHIQLPDDLYYRAKYEILLSKLQNSLVEDVMTVLSLIRKRNFRFCKGRWDGVSGTYKLAPIDNPTYVGYYSIKPLLKKVIRVQRPNPRIVMDIKKYKLDHLAKEGEACGLNLKSKTWQNSQDFYEFQAQAGGRVFLSPSALNAIVESTPMESPAAELQINNITAFDIHTRKIIRNYYLVSDTWAGLSAVYKWKNKDNHRLKASLADMLKIDKVFSSFQVEALKLTGAYTMATVRWRGPNAIYNWIAKDGLKLRSTLAKLIFGDTNLKAIQIVALRAVPGIKLLDCNWQGDNFKYSWQLPSGPKFKATIHQLTVGGLRLALMREEAKKIEPDIVLLSVLWRGASKYQWRLPSGDVLVATVFGVKKHLKAQKALQAAAQAVVDVSVEEAKPSP